MKEKINLGIIFGGKTTEHEVSVKSAKNVYDAVDKEKYNIISIGIGKDWQWYMNPTKTNGCVTGGTPIGIVLGSKTNQFINLKSGEKIEKIDVIFPILHGTYGEDGTVQGLFKLLDTPFVGTSILGSAIGIDKEVMKKMLRDADIPFTEYLVLYKYTDEIKNPSYEELESKLGLPFYVKPASLGSSVGISKVNNKEAYEKSLEEAFKYDQKLIVEKNIVGREIECAVLGNTNPKASMPGEVRVNANFYSYEAKYLDEKGADLDIPANLPEDMIKKIQKLAIKTYKALYCEGLTRVDFFIDENQKLLINEVNTMPGFTKISMYPKLWEVGGLAYAELIDRLIELAIQRYDRENELKTTI